MKITKNKLLNNTNVCKLCKNMYFNDEHIPRCEVYENYNLKGILKFKRNKNNNLIISCNSYEIDWVKELKYGKKI